MKANNHTPIFSLKLIILIMLLPLIGYSQYNINQGKELSAKLGYFEAAKFLEDALAKKDNADNVEAKTLLANCYRLTNQYEKAEKWYEQVAKAEGTDALQKLYYAQMLQINGKYGEAATWYNNYRMSVPSDVRADNQLQACQNYRQFFVDAANWEIKDLPFNSSSYDFSPTPYKGGLMYTSSRDSAKSINHESTWTGTSFFDIYRIERDTTEGENTWKKPKEIPGAGNTKYHDGPVSFSSDEQTVIFTRNNYNLTGIGRWGKSSEGITKLKMYTAKLNEDKWEEVTPFAYNNDEYSVGHPALSGDTLLYFVSDMPGGYGGTDLYVSKKAGEGWGTPENLGPELNTEGDEMFPAVNSEGDLMFSSDGQGGLGGLDVFKVSNVDGKWGKVKNLGSPVNSGYDDFGFVYSKDKSKGYFTSDRPGGHGSDDIYSWKNESILLEVVVYDRKTGDPICQSNVDLNYKGASIGNKKTECDGYAEFSVMPGRDYRILGSAEGYLPNGVDATTRGVEPGGKLKVRIPLDKPEPCKLEVLVIDKLTRMPIGVSKVIVSGDCDQSTQYGVSDTAGTSKYDIKCDQCKYVISGNATGYLPGETEVTTTGINGSVMKGVVELEKIAPVAIILRHVYYDFDKWDIRKESETDLNKVLEFMQENPDAIVEIGSHTDARASYAYNITLSDKRAKSAVSWLIKHGADKEKVVAKGYGETQPLNKCADNIKCTEEEHQQNRRTEFRIIGSSIDLKSIQRFDIQIDPCTDCPF